MTTKLSNMTTKLQKMINLSKKLTNSEFKELMKYIDKNKFGINNMEYLLKEHAENNLNYKTLEKINENNEWIKKEYSYELSKIHALLNNEKIQKEIGFIGIMAYGPTGTGKTTLLKEMGKLNKRINFEILNLENLVSSKMGQTQINILTLAEKFNSNNERKIIFIDEIDSIISNRNSSNDVGEHSRIVSTFIKFLDNLNDNNIIMAATNVIEKIDKAILRRFNIQIKSRTLKIDVFLHLINNNKIKISKNGLNFLKSGIKRNDFTISEVEDFNTFAILEKHINKKNDDLLIILRFFKKELSFDFNNITKRKKEILRKVGIYE